MTSKDEAQVFESLLDYLRRARGFDFTGYKRASLQRRVTKRMRRQEIDNFGDYLDYLEVHPEEFVPLFNTILINVTGFFRDASAWQYLSEQILPDILAQKLSEEPVRVWSAGCASGEEAYTLAILLAEALGPEQFRQRVKIYATDVDEDALATARRAAYSAHDIDSVRADLRQKYFEPIGDRFIFGADLRRAVIFGRHDLVQDAPISRLDLLACRNTLMYFNSETQSRILARFHFALNPYGALFLGKAEMLLTHANLFTPLSLQNRIFSKVPKVNLRDRLLVLAQTGDNEASSRLAGHVRLREAVFNAMPIAQIIIDLNGVLVLANTLARTMFKVTYQDLGRPLQDLEISYRPIELRARIEEVYSERTPILIRGIPRPLPSGKLQYLDIQISPLEENDTDLLGVSVTFTDVSRYHQLQEDLQRSTQELETTNEELQSSNEELETTNEELQSTNEELETINEELQSTNEELETMNEELQSTNEELQTMNDELRERTIDLNQTNELLNSIMVSLRLAVVVVDCKYNILAWNHEAEDLWGLREDEVQGQSLLSLDIGLPVGQLRESIRACLAGNPDHREIVVEATNRRGHPIQCRISFNPLSGLNGQRRGVILLMEIISAV